SSASTSARPSSDLATNRTGRIACLRPMQPPPEPPGACPTTVRAQAGVVSRARRGRSVEQRPGARAVHVLGQADDLTVTIGPRRLGRVQEEEVHARVDPGVAV